MSEPGPDPIREMTGYPATPELDRMLKIADKSQKIGEFIEWLGEQGYAICVQREFTYTYTIDVPEPIPGRPHAHRWVPREREGKTQPLWTPVGKPIPALLAAFFGLDQNAMERERMAVLDYVRKQGDAK